MAAAWPGSQFIGLASCWWLSASLCQSAASLAAQGLASEAGCPWGVLGWWQLLMLWREDFFWLRICS